jgi:hypothetical protein
MKKVTTHFASAVSFGILLSGIVFVAPIHAFAKNSHVLPFDPKGTQKVPQMKIEKKFISPTTIFGTISAIHGSKITVTLSNPPKGSPATIVVDTTSAKITLTKDAGAPVKGAAKPKMVSRKTKEAARETTSVGSLSVGDVVQILATTNADKTLTALHVSAHAPKPPKGHQTN